MNKLIAYTGATLLLLTLTAARAEEWNSSTRMTQAAQSFLATLEPRQRRDVHFPFEAGERSTWSNLPVLMVPPSGMLLRDMNDAQRQATQALLRASMSSQGYAKFNGIMRLEELLHEQAMARLEQNTDEERAPFMKALAATRDANNYAVAIFGEPGAASWGWKLAGHHAAANFTVAGGRVSFTPTFLGSSPRIVESGPYAGTMALPKEGDRAIALMESLSAPQREKALLDEELAEGIFAGPGRQDSLQGYEGLPAGELEGGQQRLLRALVEEYVRNAEYDAADAQLAAIDAAGWDALWFSWRGPVEAEGRFYYRVHGPRVLIEYNRVDANHDHSIVRDPANDYGADWLGMHLEEHHPTGDQIRKAVRERLGANLPD